MVTEKTFAIATGVALWLSLVFSFVGGLTLHHLPGVPASQLLMVLFLVAATLLLGMLIGKSAAAPVEQQQH